MTNILAALRRKSFGLLALWDDNRGAAAVTIAFALTGLVGMAGLATEASNWYFVSRRMQSAADAAAFSAAVALSASDCTSSFGSTNNNCTAQGKALASTAYNLTDGSNGVTISFHNPPSTGTHTSNQYAVEAVISQAQTRMLSSLFMASNPTISARAVAVGNVSSGCVLALNRSNVVDLTNSGNTTMNLSSCSVYVNSDDPTAALDMNGHVTINSSGVYVTGGISEGQGTINDGGNTHTNSPPINDPYANVPVPSTTTQCPKVTVGGLSTGSTGDVSLTGGTASLANPTGTCVLNGPGGLSLTGQSSLTLSPGVYIIDGSNGTASLNLGGQATLSGTGVTIVLTGSGSNYAQAQFAGGSTVTLTAPTSGSTKGLAIFQDRNAPQCTGTSCNKMVGGSTQDITGAIYFPNQAVKFTGNSSTGGPTCTQLIGYELDFDGTSNLTSSGCNSAGTSAFGNPTATMVE